MAIKTIEQAQNAGVVLGLKWTGPPVPRRDIDDLLLTEPDTFNLFLLALRELQKASNKDNKMGYYQIASIHGMPLIKWDNETPLTATHKNAEKQDEKDFFAGYCAHSTGTFPTWHRPYLAMIEQTIYAQMAKIAESFELEEHRKIYRKALTKFRLPYWDYYKPRAVDDKFSGNFDDKTRTFPYYYPLPKIFTEKEIMLRTVEDRNELRQTRNPLWSFVFPKELDEKVWLKKFKGDTISYWKPETSRYDGDVTALNKSLNDMREGFNEKCNNLILFTAYDKFKDVITNRFDEGNGPAGSIEDLHNNYHDSIGGGGQMSDPNVAAFDPVFWIHHCQIDRIFAIWQASHPKEWYTVAGKDPLYPFRSDEPGKRAYWSSNDSQYTTTFGYTYADIEYGDAQTVQNEYRKRYDWAVRYQRRGGPKEKKWEKCPVEMQPPTREQLAKAQVFSQTTTSQARRPAQKAVSGAVTAILDTAMTAKSPFKPDDDTALVGENPPKFTIAKERVFSQVLSSDLTMPEGERVDESEVDRRWYIDNVVERLALNGTFTIFYFIGPFDDNDGDRWRVAPTLAGSSHNFAAPVEVCDNCGKQAEQGVLVSGTTAITPILLDYMLKGELLDLAPEHVEPFLVKNLRWRILKLGEGRVDPRIVRGLRIGISSKVDPLTPHGRARVEEHPHIIEQIINNSA